MGRGRHESLHQLNGLIHKPRWLNDMVFSAEAQTHTPATGTDPCSISDIIRAYFGHWPIAQENSGFFILRAYHASRGRQGWEHLHRSMTRGELDKAAETPRNEKSDAACSVTDSQFQIRVVTGQARGSPNLDNRDPTHLCVNMHRYAPSSSEQ